MRKTQVILSTLMALVCGVSFVSQAKATAFQKKLSKQIAVSVKDKSVQPICGSVCNSKKD